MNLVRNIARIVFNLVRKRMMNQLFMSDHKLNQVLVALDLSGMDGDLLKYLQFLSGEVNISRVHFLHVLPAFDVLKSPFFPENEELDNVWQLNDAAWEAIKKETNLAFPQPASISTTLETVTGNPLEVILDKSKLLNPSLLIVGDKDRAEGRGILVKNLVRKSSEAILFIPKSPKTTLDHILVPIDFSENAGRALKAAINLATARDMPTRVTCLNVYDLPEFSPYFLSRPRQELKHMMESSIKEAFDRFVASYSAQEKDLLSLTLIEKLQPGTTRYITDYAREHYAGLIVMGAKGHSALERLLIGSITEHILTLDEDIPVLVIK